MSKFRFFAIVGVVAALVLAIAPSAAPARAISFPVAPVYGITCSGITQSNGNAQVLWDRNTSGQGNETLLYEVTDGMGTVLFLYNDVRSVGSTATLVGFSYTTPPAYNPIRFRLTSPAGNGLPEQVLFDLSGTCAGLPTVEPEPEPVAVPGCAVLMNITSSSVVGAFVADTPVYSTPGNLASPALTLQAGKTAWVLGKDATGQYYKIVWACSYLWVPVGTMGPNPDAVWRNTPLPTGVVQ